jgi:hypothetical protein
VLEHQHDRRADMRAMQIDAAACFERGTAWLARIPDERYLRVFSNRQ